MQASDAAINLIKEFEGLRLNSYQDSAGIWTVGIGTTRINGQSVQPNMIITESDAEDYLRIDLGHFEDAINQAVTASINQNQFDALVCFVYNIGAGNFRSSTLLKKLNAGDFDGAAAEFPKWNKAGGHVLAGLQRRRLAEQALFES